MVMYELSEKELIDGILDLLIGVYKQCGKNITPVQKVILRNGIKKEFEKGRKNK